MSFLGIPSIATRAFALFGSGELDKAGVPLQMVIGTLARYPDNRPLESEEDLRAFVLDDEHLRLGLSMLLEMVSDLDLSDPDDPEFSDTKDDIMAGLKAWLSDLRRLAARHPNWKDEHAERAAAESLATIARLTSDAHLTAPGAGDDTTTGPPPSGSSPASGKAVCISCGWRKATAKLFDMDVCDTCLGEAQEYAKTLLGGSQ